MRLALLRRRSNRRRRAGARGPAAAAAAAALLLAAPAAARTLRVGTSGDYPPFSSAGEGDLSGFDVAVARAYAEERGLRVEFVRFRWPKLGADLAADRFDLAMGGITVRPERSLAGRFSVPVAESGAVVLVRGAGRFDSLDEVDQRKVRIAVNAGGHLERVARARFHRASLVFVPDNDAVLAALLGFGVDAAVSDTLEAPLWSRGHDDLGVLGPFTRDRKAYLVAPDHAALAADLDAWLLEREADGSLARLRARLLGNAAMAPTATPLGALLAAVDERLALMPLVVAAKRAEVLPIADPAREERVVEAGVAAVASAAGRAGRAPPEEATVRAFFRAQIEAARQVQLAAGRDPDAPAPERVPSLENELRPALLRIGERMAALLVALPPELTPTRVATATREALRSPWLHTSSRLAIADAIVRVAP